MTVQNYIKIVRTVFEKFEVFMKRSGEKHTKKQDDWISRRNFFPTPKQTSHCNSRSLFTRKAPAKKRCRFLAYLLRIFYYYH